MITAVRNAAAKKPIAISFLRRSVPVTSKKPQLKKIASNDISESYRTEKTGNKEMILAVAAYPETQMTEDEVYEFAKQENYKTVEKISEKGLAVIYLLQKDE